MCIFEDIKIKNNITLPNYKNSKLFFQDFLLNDNKDNDLTTISNNATTVLSNVTLKIRRRPPKNNVPLVIWINTFLRPKNRPLKGAARPNNVDIVRSKKINIVIYKKANTGKIRD